MKVKVTGTNSPFRWSRFHQSRTERLRWAPKNVARKRSSPTRHRSQQSLKRMPRVSQRHPWLMSNQISKCCWAWFALQHFFYVASVFFKPLKHRQQFNCWVTPRAITTGPSASLRDSGTGQKLSIRLPCIRISWRYRSSYLEVVWFRFVSSKVFSVRAQSRRLVLPVKTFASHPYLLLRYFPVWN